MLRKTNKPITIMQTNPESDLSEIYRNLSFNLDFTVFDQGMKTIAVTSAHRGEGKTTTAVNLAESIAQNGLKVILIDCNLRDPAVHLAFQLRNRYGLSNYLMGEQEVLINPTHSKRLFVITAGSLSQHVFEFFNNHKLYALLNDLKTRFDAVIIDTAPLLQYTDAKIMATESDGVIFVVEYGKLKRSLGKKIKQDFELMQANLLGIVLNKVNRKDAKIY